MNGFQTGDAYRVQGIGKRLQVDFETICVVRGVCQPPAVGRDCGSAHLIWCLQQRPQRSFVGHLQQPDIAGVRGHRDKRVALWRPSSEMEMTLTAHKNFVTSSAVGEFHTT